MRPDDLTIPSTEHELANGLHGGLLLSAPRRLQTARVFGVKAIEARDLTTEVSLERYVPDCTNQGATGSCAAHSAAKQRHALVNRWREQTGQDLIDAASETFSPLWEYYWTRVLMQTFPQDSGSDMESACKAMLLHSAVLSDEIGWDPESAPYDVTVDISDRQPESADWYAIGGYERVGGNWLDPVASLIAALKSGYVVSVAVMVYDTFFSGNAGHSPLPTRGAKFVGGHAIPVYRYIPDTHAPGGGWFKWRGSWDTSYGDGGDGYLSVSYIANARLTPEMWKVA